MARLGSLRGDGRRLAQGLFLLASASIGVSSSACSAPATLADELIVEWKLTPPAPAVDRDAAAEIALYDRSRQPVTGASLRIEAHMTHPGMAPLIRPVREDRPGVYAATVSFAMAGDWIVVVSGQGPDGRRLRRQVAAFTVRAPG